MTPSGKLMSVPIQPNIPLLFYRGDLYKEKGLKAAGDLRRSRRQRQGAARSAEDVRHRPARRPRAEHRVLRLLSVSVSASAARSSRIRRTATTRSRSTTTRARRRSTTTCNLAKDAGHPKTAVDRPGGGHPGAGHRPCRAMPAWSSPPGRRWTTRPSRRSSTRSSMRRRRTRRACRPGPALGHWLGGISHQRAGRPQARRGGVPPLVPDQGRAARQRQGRRHSAQRLGLQRADRGGAQVPLDEAAGSGPAARHQPVRRSRRRARSSPSSSSASTGPSPARSPSTDALNSMSDDIHKVMEKYKYKTGEAAAAEG